MNDKLKHLLACSLITLTCGVSAQVITPVPYDKKYHMGAGVLAGVWGTFAGNSLNLTPEGSALFGMGAVTVAAFGKEAWDVSWRVVGDKNAQADPMDAAATILGGAISVGLVYAGLKIFKRAKPYYAAVNNRMTMGIKINF